MAESNPPGNFCGTGTSGHRAPPAKKRSRSMQHQDRLPLSRRRNETHGRTGRGRADRRGMPFLPRMTEGLVGFGRGGMRAVVFPEDRGKLRNGDLARLGKDRGKPLARLKWNPWIEMESRKIIELEHVRANPREPRRALRFFATFLRDLERGFRSNENPLLDKDAAQNRSSKSKSWSMKSESWSMPESKKSSNFFVDMLAGVVPS